MTTIEGILDSIDGRLRELNQQIAALTAARAALDGRDARSPRTAARRRRRRPARRREVVPAGKLELLLAQTEGLTTGALADEANGDHAQVLTLLRELEAAGRIRRTGERRATRWHVISDEERIQERAAELAARSKSAGA